MITRSKHDSSREYFEIPNTRRKRQKKETQQPPAEQVESTGADPLYMQQPQYEPNITIAYYERPPMYEVNIDFDEAHKEWVKNKVKLQNGHYRYKKERKSKIQK
jgi:hypothetical protein